MPVTDAYATAAAYRAIFGANDASGDVALLDDITAVSRYLDWKLERFFTKDTAVVARIYVPEVYTDSLYVADIASTSGLLIKVDTNRNGVFTDESAFAATDYQLKPLNADKGSDPRPWNCIYIPPWSSKGNFQPGYQVEVTAIYGFPSVPKAIERAVCHLTGILRLDSPRATARIPESMDQTFSASKMATSILTELVTAYGRISAFS